MSDEFAVPKPQQTSPLNPREQLIDTAMSMIIERGDLTFSLRQLADAADTSTMAIYTQFGNRDGLYRALAARAFDLFASEVRTTAAKAPSEDVVAILHTMAGAYRQFAHTYPSAYDLIFGGIVSFETVPPFRDDFQGLPTPSENGYQVYGMFISVFENGVQDGVFRSDVEVRLLMDSYWSQVHGLIALERLGYVRSAKDAQERFDFGLQSVLTGLRVSHAR